MKRSNLALIGMPGAGKSTFGVVLAKALAMTFIDTDLLLQSRYQASLQTQLDNHGVAALRQREAELIRQLDCEHSVIATGGSAVYSPAAMAQLQQLGRIIYLQASEPVLRQRIHNMQCRGIASPPEHSFNTIYRERTPLYEQYAELTLNTDNEVHWERAIGEVTRWLNG